MKTIFLLFILIFPVVIYAQEKEIRAVIETNMGNITVKLYNDTPKHRDAFVQLARSGHYDGTLFYRVIKDFMIQGGSSDSKNAIPGQVIGYGKSKIIDSEIRDIHYHKKGALAAPRQPDRVNFFKESDIAQFYIVDGRKYPIEELDLIEKKVNNPIRNAIQKKYYTKEKKILLDSLRKLNKVKEFREIANKIKQDMAFEWEANTDKIYMPEDKKQDYHMLGGVDHLDREYTVFGEVIDGLDVIDKIAALPTDSSDRPLKDVRMKIKILN